VHEGEPIKFARRNLVIWSPGSCLADIACYVQDSCTMQDTKGQHYVFAEYLRGWTQEGVLWCMRSNGDTFSAIPRKVGKRRYFYKLVEMTAFEEFFYQRCLENACSEARAVQDDWQSRFNGVFARRRAEEAAGVLSEARANDFDIEIRNIEEAYLSQIEGKSVRYLDELRCGKLDLLAVSEPQDSLQFFGYFLALQYLRTPKIAESFNLGLPGFDPAKAPFRHMFAANLGWAFASRRAHHCVRMLEAPSGVEFITGDQPVYNLHAANSFDPIRGKLSLYYPVSPRFALQVDFDNSEAANSHSRVSEQSATRLNDFIARMAVEQIYASELKSLERARLAREGL